MKKISIALICILSLINYSCNKEDDNTSAGAMAGEWYVTIDQATPFHLYTSNTEDNVKGKLLITDRNVTKYKFSFVANYCLCDMSIITPSTGALSSLDELLYNADLNDDKEIKGLHEITIVVKTGIVKLKALKLPSGQMADVIEMTMTFSTENPVVEHKITGYRISGFEEDDGYIYVPQ